MASNSASARRLQERTSKVQTRLQGAQLAQEQLQKQFEELQSSARQALDPPPWLQLHLEQSRIENERRSQEHREMMLLLAAQANGGRQGQTLPTSEAPKSISNAPRPPPLEPSMSLRDFLSWRGLWEDYATLSRIDRFPRSEQVALLRSCFSIEMRNTLMYIASIDTEADMDVLTLLDSIHAYFRSKRNITLDRVAFEERRQHAGETFDDFYIALCKLAAEADLCRSCHDERMTTRIISGIHHTEVKKKLLALDPFPTCEAAVKFCRSEELASDSARLLTPSTALIHKATTKKACRYCGKDHVPGRSQCPAKKATCNNCGKMGHFGEVCEKAISMEKDSTTVTRARSITISGIDSQLAKSAPKVNVFLSNAFCEESYGNCSATPDTGADATIIGAGTLEHLFIEPNQIHPVRNIEISAANGSALTCLGTLTFRLMYGDHSAVTKAFVCENYDGMLLSWHTCRELSIIPRNYPEPIVSSASPAMSSTGANQTAKAITCSKPGPLEDLQPNITPTLNAPDPIEQNMHDVLGQIPDMPTEDQRDSIQQKLMSHFSDVFSSKEALKPMDGTPMVIHTKPNSTPVSVRAARPFPIPWRGQVKSMIDDMERQGIIKPVGDTPAPWCHPLVIVPKESGGLRICVDMSKLNSHVNRPLYPLKTPKDAVSEISSTAKYFTTLDATHGYWQVPLAEESQPLTTFITPWGRYMFLRAPMGLVSTGDEYCRRGDIALAGISNLQKVVDDMLLHDETFRQHVGRTWSVLLRCRTHGITLNPAKFHFAKTEVSYVGYIVSGSGVTADPQKVEAIQKFPEPTNLTELRSFMGLVTQLGDFTDRISSVCDPLRPLLSSRNVFLWTSEHSKAFKETKEALVSPPVLAHFDPLLPTAIHTDASRLKGLGYALLQRHGSSWRLVQCGSRFISDTESRYAMVELEMLAAVWAIQKCRVFLLGLPSFNLIVDHQPLIPLFNNYTLDMIENPRLQRLKAKLSMFVFHTTWKKGKEHAIPDALSRAPVWDPSPDDVALAMSIHAHVHALSTAITAELSEDDSSQPHLHDKALQDLGEAAAEDPDYMQLHNAIVRGFPRDSSPMLKHFEKLQSELTTDGNLVLFGNRLVIPEAARGHVLNQLHASHQGLVRTKRRARQTVYWPGINNDISLVVQSCPQCQVYLPSQPAEPLLQEPLPSRVFEDVSMDLFSYASNHYLVYVDRLSGWPSLHVWYGRDPSSRDIVKVLRQNFIALGVPVRIRSDGGPQFSSHEFNDFLQRWGVHHSKSSPHFPQSNGHAESAVRAMKHLVAKSTKNGSLDDEAFDRAILEWRNTPNNSGHSPAEVLFGHPLRSVVPSHRKAFAHRWRHEAVKRDKEAISLSSAEQFDRTARPLKPLSVGLEVLIQDTSTKRWNRSGTIVSAGKHRDYLIKLPSGRTLWRNRRFLRPLISADSSRTPSKPELPPTTVPADKHEPAEPQHTSAPRRTQRLRRPPQRYGIS